MMNRTRLAATLLSMFGVLGGSGSALADEGNYTYPGGSCGVFNASTGAAVLSSYYGTSRYVPAGHVAYCPITARPDVPGVNPGWWQIVAAGSYYMGSCSLMENNAPDISFGESPLYEDLQYSVTGKAPDSTNSSSGTNMNYKEWHGTFKRQLVVTCWFPQGGFLHYIGVHSPSVQSPQDS